MKIKVVYVCTDLIVHACATFPPLLLLCFKTCIIIQVQYFISTVLEYKLAVGNFHFTFPTVSIIGFLFHIRCARRVCFVCKRSDNFQFDRLVSTFVLHAIIRNVNNNIRSSSSAIK